MQYRYLGRSGLLVSRVCLGTMTFGMKDWGCDQKEANGIVSAFVGVGGNFIDTADMYSTGVSEEMLGKAIKDHDRDDLVLATKLWFRMRKGPNAKGLSRKHVVEAAEGSLRRLGTDYIDLYQVHGPDWFTPMEETMRALDDLVRTGKVRYIGCSNYYAWQIVKANAIADQFHTQRFISAQHMYNLVRRDIECEILPACVDQGMGMLCWSPLASGFLSGRYKREEQPPDGSRISYRKDIDIPRYYREGAFDIVDELVAIANETDKSSAQVALAWLLHDHRVTAVIIGPRLVEHATNCLVVGDWGLTDEQYERLSNVCPFKHGYPWEWIEMTYGNIGGGEEFTPPHVHHVMKRG
ncbi:MAG: aldo/keto reductase [Phycisphaeraceae bacterium]|nr:aldo/keto reductase [Phycisphaeraceae bacterium]